MITVRRPGATDTRVYLFDHDTCDGDLDLVAIERAVNGEGPVALTWDEQIDAARRLAALGYGPSETARRIGAPVSRVSSWKAVNYRPRRRPAHASTERTAA